MIKTLFVCSRVNMARHVCNLIWLQFSSPRHRVLNPQVTSQISPEVLWHLACGDFHGLGNSVAEKQRQLLLPSLPCCQITKALPARSSPTQAIAMQLDQAQAQAQTWDWATPSPSPCIQIRDGPLPHTTHIESGLDCFPPHPMQIGAKPLPTSHTPQPDQDPPAAGPACSYTESGTHCTHLACEIKPTNL